MDESAGCQQNPSHPSLDPANQACQVPEISETSLGCPDYSQPTRLECWCKQTSQNGKAQKGLVGRVVPVRRNREGCDSKLLKILGSPAVFPLTAAQTPQSVGVHWSSCPTHHWPTQFNGWNSTFPTTSPRQAGTDCTFGTYRHLQLQVPTNLHPLPHPLMTKSH